ncbi:MAG: adenylyl-sulfate kinase [Ignavibacteria bacterium]
MIIWLTGLSGSGKTTISSLLKDLLQNDGYSVEWYDGDRVRKELNRETDFSKEGILKNSFELINRINAINEKVDFTIVSLITPFNEVREHARNLFGEDYFEIFVKCDKNTLIERDTKGLYKKALNGEIDNLIGFSEKLPYEEPTKPDLIIQSNLISPENAVNNILGRLKTHNITSSNYRQCNHNKKDFSQLNNSTLDNL